MSRDLVDLYYFDDLFPVCFTLDFPYVMKLSYGAVGRELLG